MWHDWNLELANVPVKGWIINPNIHGLLYGHCEVVLLSTNYQKVVKTYAMTRDVAMVIGGRRGSKVFLEPFTNSPCRFPYVLLIAFQLVTLVPVDYPTFLCDVVPVLGRPPEGSQWCYLL